MLHVRQKSRRKLDRKGKKSDGPVLSLVSRAGQMAASMCCTCQLHVYVSFPCFVVVGWVTVARLSLISRWSRLPFGTYSCSMSMTNVFNQASCNSRHGRSSSTSSTSSSSTTTTSDAAGTTTPTPAATTTTAAAAAVRGGCFALACVCLLGSGTGESHIFG